MHPDIIIEINNTGPLSVLILTEDLSTAGLSMSVDRLMAVMDKAHLITTAYILQKYKLLNSECFLKNSITTYHSIP
jgi:hypothetical protein